MINPAAIIYVNREISDSVLATLQKQLFINHTVDGYVFDANYASNDQYVNILKQMNQRVLVIRSVSEWINRGTVANWSLADVVVYVKAGLICVEQNKFGPPGITLPVQRICWGALGVH